MKHYKIVKRSAYFAIAISAFAIFFNAFLLAAIQTGLTSMSVPTITKAVEDQSCSGLANDLTLTAPATVKVDDLYAYTVTSKNSTNEYSVQIYAEDISSGKGYTRGESFILNSNWIEGNDIMTSAGKKILYARFVQKRSDGHWCTDWLKTNEVSITVQEQNTTDSANIEITVPEKTDQGSDVSVSYKITGGLNKSITIYISKGGNCADQTDNTNCWDSTSLGALQTDTSNGTHSWQTGSADVGRHGIMIKLFDTASSDFMDKKIVFATICAPGTASTTCVSDSPVTTTSNEDTKITVPDEITQFSSFSSPFKMPNKITGVGQLITVIIVVLEEILGALAFIGIVVSGIQYVSSGGDTAKAEKAKKNLIYCVIGIVVAVLSLGLQSIIAKFWLGPS